MRIILKRDDGTKVDITEGVRVAYDMAHSSMDWGSGLLDRDEVNALRRFARVCGFEMPHYEGDVCTCGHKREWHAGHYSAMPGACGGVLGKANGWHRREISAGETQCSCSGFTFDEANLT